MVISHRKPKQEKTPKSLENLELAGYKIGFFIFESLQITMNVFPKQKNIWFSTVYM